MFCVAYVKATVARETLCICLGCKEMPICVIYEVYQSLCMFVRAHLGFSNALLFLSDTHAQVAVFSIKCKLPDSQVSLEEVDTNIFSYHFHICLNRLANNKISNFKIKVLLSFFVQYRLEIGVILFIRK